MSARIREVLPFFNIRVPRSHDSTKIKREIDEPGMTQQANFSISRDYISLYSRSIRFDSFLIIDRD